MSQPSGVIPGKVGGVGQVTVAPPGPVATTVWSAGISNVWLSHAFRKTAPVKLARFRMALPSNAFHMKALLRLASLRSLADICALESSAPEKSTRCKEELKKSAYSSAAP